MFRNIRNRIVAGFSAIVLASGLVLSLGSSTAFAASGNQYCTTGSVACLNAWNGGPFVNVYTARGTSNNDFFLEPAANGTYSLLYAGTSGWNGRCVGDAYNNPSYAYASLDVCPDNNGANGGWGTNFTLDQNCANGGYAFKSIHWNNGYLAPGNYMNGTAFYLNSPIPVCFKLYPGA